MALYDTVDNKRTIDAVQKDIRETYEQLYMTRRGVFRVDDWVQVFVADATPFFGKIHSIHGDHVALCGVFEHSTLKRQAFEKQNLLPVSYDCSMLLEDNNK